MTPSPGDRRARREAQRAEARQAAARRTPASRWLLPGLIGAAVVVAAVLAIALSGGGTPTGGSSTVPPSGASGGPAASGTGAAAQAPVITGTSLPEFQAPTGDAAIGRPAPEVTGADLDGSPVAIEADGRPKIVLFLAHWCPHCQEEVPVVQAWITAGGLPSGVDFVSVATAIDPNAPNYPPDAWLDREGWTAPVIVDPTNSVAQAYGLSAFPFWVFVGPDGTVRARTVGSVPAADLEAMIRDLTGS
jgi:cytochrome c biogenesis protein CcmG/thiol:disulfide interchange protein DsbE